jgi:DNA-binding ferritin-like protein (Dps family)
MFITKLIGEKREWRAYKARKAALPEPYLTAINGVERYLMYAGGADSPNWSALFTDLVELFEMSAASGTSIRDIVGDDPVEFVDNFVLSYPQGQWRKKEQNRLIAAIDQASGDKP